MAKYGFVYLLANDCMPDIYKIGCTERSPKQRAEELSSPTAVPGPYEVLCYVEVDDFQAVEAKMHRWFAQARVNENREFFRVANIAYLLGIFKYLREAESFCLCEAAFCHVPREDLIPDPWQKKVDEGDAEEPEDATEEKASGIEANTSEVPADGADQNNQA